MVAAFLILINGYLLLLFFSEEVHGALLSSTVSITLVVYVIFILYLILRNTALYSKFASRFLKSS